MQPNCEEYAQAIFDARLELKGPTPQKIVASILFDSLTQPFADARGATDARQVVMRAEEFDIHLKISANPSQHQIVGQVFARNETQFLNGVCLHLLLNGKAFKTTWSDNFGQFQFDEVPQGVFHLQLDLPRLTVVGGITISEQTLQEVQNRLTSEIEPESNRGKSTGQKSTGQTRGRRARPRQQL